MAQSIEQSTRNPLGISTNTMSKLWTLRLTLAWTIVCTTTVGLFATSWDIQWHSAVGRDRTLTMPHLFILGSITLTGLAALAAVLSETVWARRNPAVAQRGTLFAGFFSCSPGAYLVGYGALAAAVAFPLDQYWHTLYGVDIAIWAPFHIMAITGFCVCCLGVTEMLASGSHLAAQQGAKGSVWAGYLGVIFALATLLGFFSILLADTKPVILGEVIFSVFPLLLGLLSMCVLMIAIRVLPWRVAATSIATINMLFGLVQLLLIPFLMTWLLGIEQQSLRPNASTIPVLAVVWQYGLIIPAVLLDLGVWLAQRRGWSVQRMNRLVLGVGMFGISATALLSPEFLPTVLLYSRIMAAGGVISREIKSAAGQASLTQVVLVLGISLLLGLLGIYIGNWLGEVMGSLMSRKEQA